MNDYTLVQEKDNTMTAHRPDCALVSMARAAGRPMVTMFGCDREPPADIARCACLTRGGKPR